jgi:hypothetical protein
VQLSVQANDAFKTQMDMHMVENLMKLKACSVCLCKSLPRTGERGHGASVPTERIRMEAHPGKVLLFGVVVSFSTLLAVQEAM